MSVGLDVHARSIVGCGLDGRTGELFERRLTPDHGDVESWVRSLPGPVAVTYEAGPTGFGLARYLIGHGIECRVAAPSKLQRPSGDRVKTDLRDAGRRRRWPRSGTPKIRGTLSTTSFKAAYGAKFPKAVAKITDDLDQLLAFYDFPAEHWIHLRTTNPIESIFATVRHRTKITRGPGSRAAAGHGVQLIEAAQDRWRAVNAPHLVALVRAGAVFEAGRLVERPDEHPQPAAA